MNIRKKRVYEPAEKADGRRFLVDRMWPRGLRKEDLEAEAWLKEAAPSKGLRERFHQNPSRWDEFRERYFRELEENPDGWAALLAAAQAGPVTLLFAAKDEEHNNAVALQEFLSKRLSKRG